MTSLCLVRMRGNITSTSVKFSTKYAKLASNWTTSAHSMWQSSHFWDIQSKLKAFLRSIRIPRPFMKHHPESCDLASILFGTCQLLHKTFWNFLKLVELLWCLLHRTESLVWNKAGQQVSRSWYLKTSSENILHVFDASLSLIVTTDGWSNGISAILQQVDGNEVWTTAFGSCILSPQEQRSLVRERKALTCL